MSLSPKALFRKPKAQPLIKAGDQARDARNWLAAADAYGRALKIKPDRADLWVQLGHAKKESGDLPGAEAAYLQSIGMDCLQGYLFGAPSLRPSFMPYEESRRA